MQSRKRLLQSETKIKGRLNYQRSLEEEHLKKESMARWKQDYLQKHKRLPLSSNSLFRLTSPTTAQPQRRSSL